MTSRERILCAMKGGKPDRVPIFIRGVYPFAPERVARLGEGFEPLVEYVRENCDQIHFWGAGGGFFHSADEAAQPRVRLLEERPDYELYEHLVETPKGPLIAHIARSSGQPQYMVKNYVQTEEDVDRVLSVPYEPIRPDIEDFHRMDKIIGDSGIVLPQIGNATGKMRSLLGTEALAIWSIEKRHLIHRLLEAVNQRIYDLVEYLLDGGVGPVIGMLGEEIATPPMLSPRDFYDFVVIYDKPIIELIHSYGRLVHIHCHGNLSQILEMFLEMGVDSTHPVETPPLGDITLVEFRRRVGNRIAIKGNIQIGDLYAAPKEKVTTACKEAIGVGGRDGAFIIAPTASPHWPYLPQRTWENYKAMIDFALKHGEYPIRL